MRTEDEVDAAETGEKPVPAMFDVGDWTPPAEPAAEEPSTNKDSGKDGEKPPKDGDKMPSKGVPALRLAVPIAVAVLVITGVAMWLVSPELAVSVWGIAGLVIVGALVLWALLTGKASRLLGSSSRRGGSSGNGSGLFGSGGGKGGRGKGRDGSGGGSSSKLSDLFPGGKNRKRARDAANKTAGQQGGKSPQGAAGGPKGSKSDAQKPGKGGLSRLNPFRNRGGDKGSAAGSGPGRGSSGGRGGRGGSKNGGGKNGGGRSSTAGSGSTSPGGRKGDGKKSRGRKVWDAATNFVTSPFRGKDKDKDGEGKARSRGRGKDKDKAGDELLNDTAGGKDGDKKRKSKRWPWPWPGNRGTDQAEQSANEGKGGKKKRKKRKDKSRGADDNAESGGTGAKGGKKRWWHSIPVDDGGFISPTPVKPRAKPVKSSTDTPKPAEKPEPVKAADQPKPAEPESEPGGWTDECGWWHPDPPAATAPSKPVKARTDDGGVFSPSPPPAAKPRKTSTTTSTTSNNAGRTTKMTTSAPSLENQFAALMDPATGRTVAEALNDCAVLARAEAQKSYDMAADLRRNAAGLIGKPGMEPARNDLLRQAAALEEVGDNRIGMAAGFEKNASDAAQALSA